MNIDDEMMIVGSLVPLKDGWFLDTNTNRRFRVDEDGNAVDEAGKRLTEDVYDDLEEER